MQTWAVDTRAHLLETALLPRRYPETTRFFHLVNMYQVLLCARFRQVSLIGKEKTESQGKLEPESGSPISGPAKA